MRRLVAALVLVFFAGIARAHELRPAYLELREAAPGEFDVTWKRPARGEVPLSLAPVFEARTRIATPITTRRTAWSVAESWRLVALEPLRGRSIRIEGLEATLTDALVRIELADGTSWVRRLTPREPAAIVPERSSAWSVAGTYLGLGVEHIALGIDHLLFVLALILVTGPGWKLVKTVSAFTLAHGATLTAATLGFVHVPSQPVEAVIALSIVFVAAEIVHGTRGREGLTARRPWLVALTFGLLHGLGFAGGLSEAGLPEAHVPLALLFFSLGVEAGHFGFVGAVLAAGRLARRLNLAGPRWAALVPAYAIGGVATFWMIERVAAF